MSDTTDSKTLVDGEVIPAAFFKVTLSNGRDVQISGPVACDVRDGALLLLDTQGRATIAWAAGQWHAVNGGI